MVFEDIGMSNDNSENFDGEVDDHGWENLVSTAQHELASCWITPIGSEMKNETRPFPCGGHIRSYFSHKDVGDFTHVARTSWGIVGIPSEFRIQWMIDREITDEHGQQLQIVKDSVKSQIILCRSEVLPSCHAMVPQQNNFIENCTIPVVNAKTDFESLTTNQDIRPKIDNIDIPPYLSTAFIPNNLKTKTDAEYHEVFFDESMNLKIPISGIFSVVMHTKYQLATNVGPNIKLFQVSLCTSTLSPLLSTVPYLILLENPFLIHFISLLHFFCFPIKKIPKVDSSTALDSNVMIFTEPVKFVSVSTPSLIVGCLSSSINVVCLLLLLWGLFHFRKKNIMKISQVSFLYAFVILGIISVSSFIYPAYDDTFCKIMKVNITSLTGMYAILIGRLWRINHVLSPLLPHQVYKTEKEAKEAVKIPWIFCFFKMITDWENYFGYGNTESNQNIKQNFRRRLPSYLLARLIFLLTLPSAIVSLYSIFAYAKIEYDYVDGSTTGHKICSGVTSAPTAFLIFYYLSIQLVTVGVAYLTNGLPDRINETQLILTASWTTLTFVIICSVIVLIGLSPTNSVSPDIDVSSCV